MNLLNPLQNRFFQFSLALLEVLGTGKKPDREFLTQLAEGFCMSSVELDEVMEALNKNGLLVLEPDSKQWSVCRLRKETVPDGTVSVLARMPAGNIEREYLQYILGLPEAALFLEPEVLQKLKTEAPNWLCSIRRLEPRADTAAFSPEDFRKILTAITQGQTIRYCYRTRDSAQYVQTECVPWKLEYSAYDRRWWLILYDPGQDRTIKAVLSNLQQVQLGTKHHISQAQILAALEKLKQPEPVTLRVKNVRNGLERCFLQFETREFLYTEKCAEELYELAFTYYKFDTEEILRKLLYLGPAVKLIGPASLKEMLRKRLQQALEIKQEN